MIAIVDLKEEWNMKNKCRHKPQDPRLIISTEYGKFYTFDRVQQCRKCGKRIEMVHKRLYKLLVAITCLSNFLWIILFLYFSDIPIARIILLGIIFGIAEWLPGYSGYIMKWRKVGLPESEASGSC
jgi:hypothetical protein